MKKLLLGLLVLPLASHAMVPPAPEMAGGMIEGRTLAEVEAEVKRLCDQMKGSLSIDQNGHTVCSRSLPEKFTLPYPAPEGIDLYALNPPPMIEVVYSYHPQDTRVHIMVDSFVRYQAPDGYENRIPLSNEDFKKAVAGWVKKFSVSP